MRKMASRAKEEERIEMILRGLLKLPENRRCINCNSLGPQYVCTTFLTFVCTNCSGIHREFTHRVKSISMAKFTAEEVSALQAAGNERARQIYLKGWDPRRNSYPDGSNLHRLRDFIKHVYVDRKYTSERSDEPLRLRLGEREEPYERRKVDAYLDEFRSPSYESRHEQSSSRRSYGGRSDDRNFRYYFDERRSLQYNRENSKFGAHRKNPVHFEIVDDRFRDDEYRSGRRSDSLNFTNREYKSGSRSPERQQKTNTSNPSVVRPIKDISRENAPPLGVEKHSKEIYSKDGDGSAKSNQKNAPSGGLHSVDRNPMEDKKMHSESLINSNTDPEPSDAAVLAQETQPGTPSSDSGNLSSHEASAKKAPAAPAQNTVEFLLFELAGALVAQSSDYAPSTVSESNMPAGGALTSVSTSTTAPTTNMQPTGGNKLEAAFSSTTPVDQKLILPSCVDTSITASTTNIPVQQSGDSIPPDGASPAISGQMSTLPSSFAASTSASTTHLLDEPSGGNIPESSVSPTAPSGQTKALPSSVGDSTTASTAIVPVSSFDGGPPKVAADSRAEPAASVPEVPQLSSMQQPLASSAVDGRCSSSQQTTTPVGLLNYQSWTSPLVPYSQGHSSASAEQSSQTASKPAQDTSYRVGSEPLSVETKSSGRKELPLDLFTGYLPVHAPVPHWQSGHGHATEFNMQYYPHAMLVPGYSNPANSTNPFDLNSETSPMPVLQQGALPHVGAHSLGFVASQSPLYASAMRPQSPSFPSAKSSSAFMGQQIHTNMTPTRLREIDSFGSDITVLGSSNTPQEPNGGYPVPKATNSFSSVRGNPFE